MRMKRRGGPLKPILHNKGETRLDEKKRKAAIEAILFTMGDAVELSRIAEAIGEDTETTRETIRKMMKDYQKKERGIQIIELDQSFQLCTKKEYYEDLIRICQTSEKTGTFRCGYGDAFYRGIQAAGDKDRDREDPWSQM